MAATSTPTNQSLSDSKASYIHQAQEIMQKNRRAKQSIFWSAVNTVGFAIVLYDLTEACHERSYFVDYLEFFLLCIFFLNIICHVVTYLLLFCSLKPFPLTLRQKKLLGVSQSDSQFPTLSPSAEPSKKTDKSTLSLTPLSLSSNNWLNTSHISSHQLSPVNGSADTTYMSTHSGLDQSLQTQNMSLSSSWNGQSFTSSWSGASPNISLSSSWVFQPGSSIDQQNSSIPETDEPITDEASLTKYLRHWQELDKKQVTTPSNLNSSPSNMSLLWSSPLNASGGGEIGASYNTSYHLAPLTAPQDLSSTGSPRFEVGTTSAICVNEAMWRREGVSPETLSFWNKNLRQWLTVTVLERVSSEVDSVNCLLQRLNASEDRVGTSGLERLKKTAAMPQVTQHVPNLSTLLPFLEVTSHQDYLITRIKDLAKGGCMSNFRWNSGGQHNGKSWEDSLPTDSAIVLHLFASYLDVQLPPLLHRPDWRPFSAQYISKATEKPKPNNDTMLIHQARVNPPHYVLYWRNEVLEVAQGCNNLMHTLLLFLHRLRSKEDGMLGRMNLGSSGINILWVIEE